LETVVVLIVAAVAEEKYTRPLELYRFVAVAVAISTMLLPHTFETTVTLVVVVKEA
jgi:hypothetical protein